MRNWNPGARCRLRDELGVLSLPMRNWNPSPPAGSTPPPRVLSLPMRNWNVGAVTVATALVHSFWAYLWGIETKRDFLEKLRENRFWAYLWGIETWRSPIFKGEYVPVLSLPMRNWNWEKGADRPRLPNVLSLPMRNWNWTKTPRCDHPTHRFEPTYEELKHNLDIQLSCTHLCFEPTYEELKQFSEQLLKRSPVQFWAYLWGIETNSRSFS